MNVPSGESAAKFKRRRRAARRRVEAASNFNRRNFRMKKIIALLLSAIMALFGAVNGCVVAFLKVPPLHRRPGYADHRVRPVFHHHRQPAHGRL